MQRAVLQIDRADCLRQLDAKIRAGEELFLIGAGDRHLPPQEGGIARPQVRVSDPADVPFQNRLLPCCVPDGQTLRLFPGSNVAHYGHPLRIERRHFRVQAVNFRSVPLQGLHLRPSRTVFFIIPDSKAEYNRRFVTVFLDYGLRSRAFRYIIEAQNQLKCRK